MDGFGNSDSLPTNGLRSRCDCFPIVLSDLLVLEVTVHGSERHFKQTKTLLEIFNFLDNALGCLESISDNTLEHFDYMITIFSWLCTSYPGRPVKKTRCNEAAIQSARKTLILSCPLLDLLDILNYLHFSGHQHFPYVYGLGRIASLQFLYFCTGSQYNRRDCLGQEFAG